jgi:hypothetical protein
LCIRKGTSYHAKGSESITTQKEDYDMDWVILDLSSDVNVSLKKTWEMRGNLKLIWSPIQLILVNQHTIVPIGRLLRVLVNIDEVHIVAYFKVIDIVDNSHPYPTLMGL